MRHLASFALALLVLQTSAASAETTVAVLGVEAVDTPANVTSVITQALVSQVRRSPGFKLVPSKDIEEIKLVFGCVDEAPDCMAKVGQGLRAQRVLWGTLRRTPAGYNLTIQWLDVERALVDRSISDTIVQTKLSAADAEKIVRRITSSFLPSDRGAMKITVDQEGAEVKVGSKSVGVSQKKAIELSEIPTGTYLVTVSKPGFDLWVRRVPVRSGELIDIDVELTPLSGPGAAAASGPAAGAAAAPARHGSTVWKTVFWTSIAAGLGMGAVSVVSYFRWTHFQDQKDQRLADYYQDNHTNSWVHSDDVCAAAPAGNDGGVRSSCQSGKRWNIANWTLGIAAGAVGLFSIYSGYKAYFARSAEETPRPQSANESRRTAQTSAIQWQLSPSAGLDGASLGLHLQF